MPPDLRTYLWDALRAAELVHDFTDGRTFADYQAVAMLRSAVERQFEIVGEALNQLAKTDPATAGLATILIRREADESEPTINPRRISSRSLTASLTAE